jgi:DinB family protein
MVVRDGSHIVENTTQRERLRALVDRLSDADLVRPLDAGWTIAGVLAHLAFWDQRALLLLERWECGGAGCRPRLIDPCEVDPINDSAKPLCLGLPARVAARFAVAIAEAVDRKVETLRSEVVAENEAAGRPVNLRRAEHRRQHLDEIERAIGR